MIHTHRTIRRSAFASLGAAIVAASLSAPPAAAQGLPNVPEPAENPITEAKRVLGKILFWDEQLSSDDSIACGTCHIPANAGADPRMGVHPGSDGVFGNADDVIGSPGVVRRDSNGDAINDPTFGFDPQVTGRSAQPYFGAMFDDDLFWDGRATSQFVDPLDGVTVVIASGGGLESQAVGPILSSVEMAKDNRTWTEVTDKLASVVPLRLGDDKPADVTAALAVDPTYPELFENAFGDSAITPVRIAFAIATYERTLVADESPWDLFIAGNNNAMTPQQIQGWNHFQTNVCDNCHTPPTFSNNDFHNIGLRPAAEDIGREDVTGDPDDFGDFKTPSLRNVGLRLTLMHTGQIEDVQDALAFYREAGPHNHFTANQDAIPNSPVAYDDIAIPGNQRDAIEDFLNNALTDPRVAAEEFPFDRPTLNSESGPGAYRCATAPATGCGQTAEEGAARIKFLDRTPDERDSFTFKWGKADVTAAEFSDPTGTDGYALCFYDGADNDALIYEGRAVGGDICGTKDCWKENGSSTNLRGYSYSDSEATPDGVRKLKLKAGTAGKAKIIAKAKGVNMGASAVGMPSLPMSLPLLVQLQSANGQCWEATFTEASSNDPDRFTARN